jgi:hypothetical protein
MKKTSPPPILPASSVANENTSIPNTEPHAFAQEPTSSPGKASHQM